MVHDTFPSKRTQEKRAVMRSQRRSKKVGGGKGGLFKPMYFDMMGHKVGPPPANKSHKRWGWGRAPFVPWEPVSAKGTMVRPAIL